MKPPNLKKMALLSEFYANPGLAQALQNVGNAMKSAADGAMKLVQDFQKAYPAFTKLAKHLQMKLKQTKTVKAKPVKKLAAFADKAGEEYERIAEEVKGANTRQAKLKEKVKSRAAKNGERDGAYVVIKGKRFTVGFQEVTATSIDEKAAKKLLPKALFEALLVQPPPYIDSDKFQKAVECGQIDQVTAAKLLVQGTMQKRIVISRNKTNPKA